MISRDSTAWSGREVRSATRLLISEVMGSIVRDGSGHATGIVEEECGGAEGRCVFVRRGSQQPRRGFCIADLGTEDDMWSDPIHARARRLER